MRAYSQIRPQMRAFLTRPSRREDSLFLGDLLVSNSGRLVPRRDSLLAIQDRPSRTKNYSRNIKIARFVSSPSRTETKLRSCPDVSMCSTMPVASSGSIRSSVVQIATWRSILDQMEAITKDKTKMKSSKEPNH